MSSDKLESQLEDPNISGKDHLEIEEHDLQKGMEEAIEVSYSVIITDNTLGTQISDDLLQKIGTMINVQLAEEGREKLPFIPFLDFERARASDKLFLYGPSGCGKSRTVFELVRENLTKFKKIYFINPRNTIGAESGRIKLLDLLGKLEEDDGVVWDNFPDDLVKRDSDTAKHVLELISSRTLKRLFVSLKPRYLEIYKDLPSEIPEFNSCQVSFDKERLRKIILAYGAAITEFKDPFQKYIAEHADRISRILWQKEPTPLTILSYYKLLKSQIEEQKMSPGLAIDSLTEAERLLRNTDYYEQQFEMICRMQERRNDAEFLYTLKLCYECGLDRTVSSVERLQFDIFGSAAPRDVLARLSTWIYVSGQYYAMHDAQRESTKFSDHVKLKIMDYLTRNFMKVVPNDDSQINTFGLFLGRNIQYVHKENLNQFLGPEIQEYMKKKRYFQTALGQGVGESFLALDDELQEEMMKRMAVDIEFARGAVLGIGERFPTLDRFRQREILEEKSKRFACVPLFAESVGINFKAMTNDLRKELFETAEKNPQFADGFGRGLGNNIKFFEQSLQEEIFERAMKNSEFTRGFGYSHAFHFVAGDKNEQKRIFEIADRNSHFSIGLGMGFAYLFGHLSERTLQQVFERIATDNEFAFGLGLYLGFNFHPLSPELQNWQFKTLEENGRFAYGLGYGYGITFPYYPQEIQSSLFEKAEKNADFAYGLGSGLGYSFGSLDENLRELIFIKIKSNPEFAGGLGAGLAFVSVLLPPRMWTDILARTEKNPRFSKGLGHGFGWILRFLPSPVRNDLFEKAEKNHQLATGLGYGIGFVFPYVPEDLQTEVVNKAETMPHLAYGLGIGIAILSRYHESQLRDGIFNRLNLNIHFTNGFGEGTGYVFKYLPNDQQQAILDRIERDTFFALGFGTGIGQKMGYLSQKLRTEMFEKMLTNSLLAQGLSCGIGMAYQFIPVEIQDTIFEKASTQVRIALGLGQGMGSHNSIHSRRFVGRNNFQRDEKRLIIWTWGGPGNRANVPIFTGRHKKQDLKRIRQRWPDR